MRLASRLRSLEAVVRHRPGTQPDDWIGRLASTNPQAMIEIVRVRAMVARGVECEAAVTHLNERIDRFISGESWS